MLNRVRLLDAVRYNEADTLLKRLPPFPSFNNCENLYLIRKKRIFTPCQSIIFDCTTSFE